VVASLEFTRPPDAKYPVPVRQANAALTYLRNHAAEYGGDSSRFFVAGNSSGSQITSQVAAIETNPAYSRDLHISPALEKGALRGVILNCGAYDMASLKNVRFPFIRVGLWTYTGYRDWTKFPNIDQLSTIKHITSDFPPVFITAGDDDPLEPQSPPFAAELRRHNVPVTTLFWEGSGKKLQHDYQFELDRPEGRKAFNETAAFLDTWSQQQAGMR
jgi:acetyl esterase/lipase